MELPAVIGLNIKTYEDDMDYPSSGLSSEYFPLFRNISSFSLHSPNNDIYSYTFVAHNLRMNSEIGMNAAFNHDKFC